MIPTFDKTSMNVIIEANEFYWPDYYVNFLLPVVANHFLVIIFQ